MTTENDAILLRVIKLINCVYLVCKTGRYIKDVYGVYFDKVRAIDDCRKFSENDIDDYHDWKVMIVNVITTATPSRSPDDQSEPEDNFIFTCNKTTARENA
jgi:hypothetical protein